MQNEAVLSYLQRTIKVIQNEFAIAGPINNNCEAVVLLLDGIERVLQCGRKENLFTTTYWDMFTSLELPWLQEAIEWITKDIPSAARGRAFLRSCLNRKLLADVYLVLCESNLREEYYDANSIVLRADESEIFLQQLRGLRDVDFSLALNQHDQALALSSGQKNPTKTKHHKKHLKRIATIEDS